MIVSLVAGFGLHIILQRYLRFNGTALNLLMLMTIQISLIREKGKGELFGFLSGLTEDVVTAGLLGEKALLRTLLGFFSSTLKGRFSEDNIIFQVLLTFTLFMLYSYAAVLLRVIFSEPYRAEAASIIIYSAFNALFAPLVYRVLKFIYAR